MVEFYLLTFPRFPLRKKEHKSYFGKNRTHDFRTSRCADYLLDHSGDDNNHILNTDLSLWTPLLSEDAACVQYKGRCCNCGSTEHSLRWSPAPFRNTFSLLNPVSGTHDPDGSKKKKTGNQQKTRLEASKPPTVFTTALILVVAGRTARSGTYTHCRFFMVWS